MSSFSYWKIGDAIRTIEREGQKVVQQIWVKRYLTQIEGKEHWVNSSDFVWADVSVNVNDPAFWETQGLNNGD